MSETVRVTVQIRDMDNRKRFQLREDITLTNLNATVNEMGRELGSAFRAAKRSLKRTQSDLNDHEE